MSDDRTGPIDPALYRRDEMRKALAGWDITALYRALKDDAGLSQRQIADRTGQRQSEVAEILSGRRGPVESHRVLRRIARGLGVAPELMGLSWWGPDGTDHRPDGGYPEEGTVADSPKGVTPEMLRRYLLALGGVAMVGQPVERLGELLELPGAAPGPVPMPSRITQVDVAKVRNLTLRLRDLSRAHGSDPEVSSAAVAWAQRLLGVPGAEEVTRELQVAVAELQVQAGWAGFDASLYERAMYHWGRAMELATKTGDAYLQALTLSYAGLATVEHGHPRDGLKMLQFGQVKSWDIPQDDQRAMAAGRRTRAVVEACALADSAIALEQLGDRDAADRELKKSQQAWTPARTDSTGDLNQVAARLELARGRLDAAEPFAVASVRRWEGINNHRARTQADVLLATVHVRASERDGLGLAHGAITGVTKLSSIRLRRQWLTPLTVALEARPGGDAQQLAQMARKVAVSRV
ncbi:MAG: helix-turn-helix domain-containing protein [Pseudonocardiaceae bacterium]